jgi:hypothetical protein
LPVEQRLTEDHTAVRAAHDVLSAVSAVVEGQGVDGSTPAGLARSARRRATAARRDVRTALARLVAEVDALIGADDGDR